MTLDWPVPRWSTTTMSRSSTRSPARNCRNPGRRCSRHLVRPVLMNRASVAVAAGSEWGRTANAIDCCRRPGRERSNGTVIEPHSQDGSSAHGSKATVGVGGEHPHGARPGRTLPLLVGELRGRLSGRLPGLGLHVTHHRSGPVVARGSRDRARREGGERECRGDGEHRRDGGPAGSGHCGLRSPEKV